MLELRANSAMSEQLSALAQSAIRRTPGGCVYVRAVRAHRQLIAVPDPDCRGVTHPKSSSLFCS